MADLDLRMVEVDPGAHLSARLYRPGGAQATPIDSPRQHGTVYDRFTPELAELMK